MYLQFCTTDDVGKRGNEIGVNINGFGNELKELGRFKFVSGVRVLARWTRISAVQLSISVRLIRTLYSLQVSFLWKFIAVDNFWAVVRGAFSHA